MEEPKFIIKSIIEKEDYRRFLYIAAFRKNKLVIPTIILIGIVVSIILNLDSLNFISIAVTGIIFEIIVFGTIFFKIELTNMRRIKSDHTGMFGSETVLKFYSDKMIMENNALNSKSELEYEKFHQVNESAEYFIFYITMNQASLFRKQDTDDLDQFREFIIEKFEGKYKKV